MSSLKVLSALALATAALGSANAATGGNITWSNNGTAWATGTNWLGATAPANDLTTNIAIFNSATFTNQPVPGTTSVAGIVVGNGSTTTGALTFGSGALTIGGDGITVKGNGTTSIGKVQMNATSTILGASQTWANYGYNGTNTTAALYANAVTTASNTNFTLTLAGNGTSGTTPLVADGNNFGIDMAGTISQGTNSTLSVIVNTTGPGLVSLNGNNTFSGGLTVKSGIVKTADVTSLGIGTVTLGDSSGSADAIIRNGSGATKIIGNAITVASGSTGLLSLQNNIGSSVAIYSGAITMANNLQIFASGGSGVTTAYTQVTGGFTGTGNLSLFSGNNTLATGAVQISGSAIDMTGTITNNGNGTASSAISALIGSHVTGLIQNSSTSSLILTGNNTAFTGATTITAGTLQIGDGTTDGSIANSSGITNNGVLAYNLVGTQTYNNLISGNGSVTKNGSGALTLGGSNNYSGGTTLAGGTLSVSSNTALGTGNITFSSGNFSAVTNDVTLQNNTSLSVLTVVGSQNLTLNGTITGNVTSRTLTNNIDAGKLLTLNSVAINTSSNQSLTLAGTGNTTITGVVSNGNATGNNGFFVTNTGTTILMSASTYTGTTEVGARGASGGTLRMVGNGTVGNNNLTVWGGTLDLNNTTTGIIKDLSLGNGTVGTSANVLIGSSGFFTMNGNVTFDATGNNLGATISGGTLNLAKATNFIIGDSSAATYDLTVSAVIAGSGGAITKSGAGTLLLSGANTYNGTTTVNGGTLLLDFSGSGAPATNIIKSGNSLVMGGGILSINGNGSSSTNSQNVVMTNTASTGLSSIVVNNNGSTGTTTLVLSSTGLGTRGTTDTMNIDLSQGLSGNAAGDLITTTATAATLGWATVTDATNTGFARYTGTGVVRLTGQTTLANNSNASTTDFITSPSGTSSTGSPYLQLNAALTPSWNTLTIDTGSATGANVFDLNSNTVTLTQKALLMTGANDFTIQNGQIGAANTEVIVQTMGAGTLTISGNVSSGTGSLTKSGAGTLILAGTQTYTGTTTVNQGTLKIGSSTSLPGANALTTLGGGTFDLNGYDQTLTGVLTNNGIVTNSGASKTLTIGNGTHAGAGAFTGAMDVIWNQAAAASTLASSWSNTGNVTLNANGAGTITLNGTVNNTGTITNSGSSTGTVTVSGTIGSNVTNVIQNSPTSILTLSGNNSAWTGGIQINSGTVATSGSVASSGTGTITLGNATTGGDAMFVWGSSYNSPSNPITVAGGAGNRTLRLTQDGNDVLYGAIAVGSNNLIVDTAAGAGSNKGFTLSGTITGTGNITLTNTAGSSAAMTTLANNQTSFTGVFVITRNATLSLGTNTMVTTGTVDVKSGGNLTFTQGATIAGLNGEAGSFSSGGTGKTLIIGGSGTYNFAGVIQNGAGTTNGFTMNGTGTQILSGSNTYNGTTTVSAGTLTLNGTGSTILNAGNVTVSGGTLDLAQSDTVNQVTLSSGNITSSTGTGTLTATSGYILNGTSNGTISAVLAGSSSLTKNGTGVVTLSGNNTYSGATTVSAGTLVLSGTNNSTGTTTLNGGGTLQLANANNGGLANGTLSLGIGTLQATSIAPLTISNTVTLSASSTVSGNQSLTFNGSLTNTSTRTLTNNMTAGNTLVLAGPVYLSNDGTGKTMNLAGTGNTTVNGTISNNSTAGGGAACGLGTAGGGIITFNGNNTHTGATTIGTGTVILNGNSTASNITLNSPGAVFTESDIGVISGGSFTVGTGTTGTLAGNNTYSGGTTINSGTGTLNINSATALGTGNFTIAGGTINNTSAAAVTLTNNNAQAWNGNFAFTGTKDLNLGTGSITMAGNSTITANNAGVLTIGGAIQSTTAGLTKAGNGTLVLTGANLYTGNTTVSGGTLSLGHLTNTLSTSSIVNISSGGTLNVALDNTVGAVNLGGGGNITGTGSLTASSLSVSSTQNANILANLAGTGTLTSTVSSANVTLSGNNSGWSGNIGQTGSGFNLSVNNKNALGTGAVYLNGNLSATADLSGTNAIANNFTLSAGASGVSGTNNITLNGSFTLATNSAPTFQNTITGGTLVLAGPVYLSENATFPRTLKINGTGNTTISGVISDFNGSGSPSNFTANSTGTTTLTNTNTYTGTTNVGTTGGLQAGILRISGLGTLSNATTTVFGGTLDLTNTTQTVTNLTLGGGAAGTTANVIIDGILNLNGGASVTYTATNNPNGGTISGNGMINLNGNRTFVVNDSTGAATDLTISAIIANGNSTSNLSKTSSGTGTLVLSGINTYTGITTISGGVLSVSNIGNGTVAGNIGAASNIEANINLDGILRYTGGTAVTDRLFRIGSSNNGTLDASGTGAITFSNTGTLGSSGNQTRTFTLTGTNTDNNTLASVIANNVVSGNATTLVKSGVGKWVLAGANTYTGNTTISAGTLQFAKQTALYTGNNTAWTASNIKVASGGTLALNVGGSVEFTTGNVTTLLGNLGGANGTSTTGFAAGSKIAFDTTGGNFTVSDIIANSSGTGGGSIGLVKLGSNTLTLTGNNSYSGNTTVNGGKLVVSDLFRAGQTGNFTLNEGTTLGIYDGSGLGAAPSGVIFAGNSTLQFQKSTSGPVGASRRMEIGSGVTATIDTQGFTDAFAAPLTGSGALTKIGSGTLMLNGTSTYTGATSVQAGTLEFLLGNTSATAAQGLGANATVNLGVASTSSGTLKYTGTGAATLAKNINALGNGADTIQNSGTGLLTLSGSLVKDGTKLTLNGGTNGITVTGVISGSSPSDLIITGGMTMLTNQETYNGPTYIQGGGTLVNGYSGGALPTGTTLYIGGTDNSTGTFDLGGNGQTIAGLNSQGTGGASNLVTNNGVGDAVLTTGGGAFAGMIQDGSKGTGLTLTDGTLVLTGNNTYTGATNVTGGTLLVNGNQTSATGALTVASGATLGGNGMIGGATTIAGSLSPGDGGIGTLNIASNVTWQGASAPGSTTDWIFQLGASNTSDLLNITGDFVKDETTYGNTFRFDFAGSANAGTFKLVNWTGSSSFSPGDFSYTNLGGGFAGSFSITGNELDFLVLPPVPEPATWIAMAALILTGGVLVLRRRCR